MQGEAGSATSENGESAVIVQCERCGISLLADTAATGVTQKCERCGESMTVPQALSQSSESTSERLAELKRHLKENESQRTEVKGYINQLSIQVHRWRLRLQTLDERNKELTNEIAACRTAKSEQSLG